MLIPSQNWGKETTADSSSIKQNLNEIQQNIAHCKTKIIAVTKYFGLSSIIAGYEAGIRDFAESRAKEGSEKINLLPESIRKNSTFHFIGHLQTNKVGIAVRNFDVIQSVDSLRVAEAISDAACHLNKREKVLLQVNNAGEEQKSGYTKEQLKLDFDKVLALKGLEVLGLMNIAPFGADEVSLGELFEDIKQFRDELEKEFNVALPELSMGMSDDYKVAIKHGATMVRIGRKLFT